ncbi:hypothetical protein FSP39_023438 [Pinctada imbricata]|uniref:TIR domain-containing protein n=1 Tax=Pinctada imbricata TaxID=66713 RepID=A0AA89C458_PINIB|nr:hypothetical protein FSP39_023438 [Pinctada imbricata]
MEDKKYDVFVVHCNNSDDNNFVQNNLMPWLKQQNLKTFLSDEDLLPGSEILPGITRGIHQSRKTLILLTEESLKSQWCTFEIIVAFEKAQRENQMSVILLLKGVDKEKLPKNGVLQAAPSIEVLESDTWKDTLGKYIREEISIPMILQNGNVAHGLVWSHFTGLLDPILPHLDEMIQETDVYKSNGSCFPIVLYELIPEDCRLGLLPSKGSNGNITYVASTKLKITNRAGNEREYELRIFSLKDQNDGKEYFFIADQPFVLNTFRHVEDDNGEDEETTQRNLNLNVARFCYTMQMILDHPEMKRQWKGNRARLVQYCDGGKESVEDILLKAIKEDLAIYNREKIDWFNSGLYREEQSYDYDAYICAFKEDIEEEKKITEFLERHDVSVAEGRSANMLGNTHLIGKSRWLIFLLSKAAMHDPEFTLEWLGTLQEVLNKGHTLVVPVILEEDREYGIPEVLRWVTYIQKMEGDQDNYMQRILKTIQGGPVPMDIKSYLPAGNVAYGLALGYVKNYLNLILQDLNSAFNKCSEPCQRHFYILLPRSCKCKNTLEEENDHCIVTKHDTILLYTAPNGRKYSCDMYKLVSGQGRNKIDYILGLYAAPVLCLYQMIMIHIGGLKEEEMYKQRQEFSTILYGMLHTQLGDKANLCRFVEFDGTRLFYTTIVYYSMPLGNREKWEEYAHVIMITTTFGTGVADGRAKWSPVAHWSHSKMTAGQAILDAIKREGQN